MNIFCRQKSIAVSRMGAPNNVKSSFWSIFIFGAIIQRFAHFDFDSIESFFWARWNVMCFLFWAWILGTTDWRSQSLGPKVPKIVGPEKSAFRLRIFIFAGQEKDRQCLKMTHLQNYTKRQFFTLFSTLTYKSAFFIYFHLFSLFESSSPCLTLVLTRGATCVRWNRTFNENKLTLSLRNEW